MNSAERREAWRALLAAPFSESGEFRVIETPVLSEERHVLFALDANSQRHLLVPVPADQHVNSDRRSRGVHLVSRTLVERESTHHFLDVVCKRPEVHGVFDQLAGEMLDALDQHTAPPDACCRAVLERWRRLLDREPSASLALNQLLGLFGELHYLGRIVTRNRLSIDPWVGPSGNQHDFVANGVALEVKTTLLPSVRMLAINGVDQLEAPSGHTLYLGVLVVERDAAQGLSIPQTVDQLIERGVDRIELLTKLLAIGYDVRDREQYDDIRFRVTEERVYEVTPEFPRIVRSSFVGGQLPPRTGPLDYMIDLRGDIPPVVGAGTEAELIRRLQRAT